MNARLWKYLNSLFVVSGIVWLVLGLVELIIGGDDWQFLVLGSFICLGFWYVGNAHRYAR